MEILNLCYVPTDAAFAARCVATAKEHFNASAQGYLLDAQKALPHVTITRFRAPAASTREIFREATKRLPVERALSFDMSYLFSDPGTKGDYVWACLAVRRERELISLQSQVVDWLATLGGVPLTRVRANVSRHI